MSQQLNKKLRVIKALPHPTLHPTKVPNLNLMLITFRSSEDNVQIVLLKHREIRDVVGPFWDRSVANK